MLVYMTDEGDIGCLYNFQLSLKVEDLGGSSKTFNVNPYQFILLSQGIDTKSNSTNKRYLT